MDHVLRLRGVRHYLVILIILLLHYMLSKEELLEAVTVNSKVTLEQMDTRKLRSLRVEVSGQRDSEGVFTAIQLIVPLSTSPWRCHREVRRAIERTLPVGTYDAKFYTTGACFTRRWLKTDVLQSLILPDPMVCIKPSKPLLRKFVVSAPHQSTKSACTNAERLHSGYWLNNTWVAGACEGVDMTQAVRAKKQYIYVAGDSVVRGMMGTFCRKINATRSHRILDENHKVRFKHCCDDSLDHCIFFRMSWFPRNTFSPKYVDTYLSTKSTYCNHSASEDFKNCLHTCPTSAFPLDEKGKHNPTNNTWHWLFYGSHSPALGASVATCEKFKSMSSGENVISYGTPAVRAALIPDKYANQRGTRTNARIATLNAMLVNCIGHNEFMDLFSPTFARPESDFQDAIHVKADASAALSELIWLLHLLRVSGTARYRESMGMERL